MAALSYKDFRQQIVDMWKVMAETSKEEWKEMARRDQARYDVEAAAYMQSMRRQQSQVQDHNCIDIYIYIYIYIYI
jgi:hypothetical protein